MGALEITLILIGLLIIAISYYISEKNGSAVETVKELETVADYEERKKTQKDIKRDLENLKEEVLASADASLCKLSNEKIMAVNEYGDMVLDRIDKNHSEVVFLYSMLTDKEKELKELIAGAQGMERQEVKDKLDEIESQMADTIPLNESYDLMEGSAISLSKSQAKVLHESKPADVEETISYDENHERILSLYRSGKSVREISKELDLGQGEVQLVVNLHAGGK